MKRQSEELFFNYIANPTQGQNDEINIDVPDEIELLPGDIIEMIVSEAPNFGGVSYYARLICYKHESDHEKDVGLLSGLLAPGSADDPLVAVSANLLDTGGKTFICLHSSAGTSVAFDSASNFLVNMIIHRSKKEITLYYY